MRKIVPIWVLIILVFFTILSMLMHVAVKGEADWGDLFVNLSSEIIGIIVTVYLVDMVIKRNEEKSWGGIKTGIIRELYIAISPIESYITDIRSAYGDTELIKKSYSDLPLMLISEAEIKLFTIRYNFWKNFLDYIKRAYKNLNFISNHHGNKLEPEIYGELFTCINIMEDIINNNAVLSDFYSLDLLKRVEGDLLANCRLIMNLDTRLTELENATKVLKDTCEKFLYTENKAASGRQKRFRFFGK